MFELIKRGNYSVGEAGTVDDVKARFSESAPSGDTFVRVLEPSSIWRWDATSTETEGSTAFAVESAATGRFLLIQTTLEDWSAGIDASDETNGYVLGIDDGRIVAQTPGTPGPHTHDLDDINQPANLAAFNDWIGVTLDTASDTRTPSAHGHDLDDIAQPSNLGDFNTWLGETLDTASDTRDPNPHGHDLDDIDAPDNLAAFNEWLGVTLDTSSDPRTPSSHNHPISQINTFSLAQLNARLSSGNLDLDNAARPPTAHEHDLDDVEAPNGLAALNSWANTNLDEADDPRDPTAHTHPISQVNTFTLAQLNGRITNADLDAAGTQRPPTAHTHPFTDLTAAGQTNGNVLRVNNGAFQVSNILSNTAPISSGGAASAGNGTLSARDNHRHDIGAFDGSGITATGGTCDIGSAAGFACLMQGSNQLITSLGDVPEGGCLRLVFSMGTYGISGTAPKISIPGGEGFTLPVEGKMLVQGVSETNIWFVLAAWNGAGQPIVGLRKGTAGGVATGGNPTVALPSDLWAPENHSHDIGKLGSTVTVNSTGIVLATTSGDVVTLQAGSISTVLNFGANSGQRRVCVLDSDLTLAAGFGLGFPSGMLSTWEAKEGDVFIAQGMGSSNWYVIPLKYIPIIEGEGSMRFAAEPGGALNPISSSQAAVDFYLVNDRVTHSTTAWQSVVVPTSKHGKTISGGIVMMEAAVFSKPTSGNASITNSGYIMRRGIWFPGSTGTASLRDTLLFDTPISLGYAGERISDEAPSIWMVLVAAGVTGPNGTVDASNLRMFYQLNSSASREVLRTVKVTGIQ